MQHKSEVSSLSCMKGQDRRQKCMSDLYKSQDVGSQIHMSTQIYTQSRSEQTSAGCSWTIICLFHLQLVLGLVLSLQLFQASGVSQDLGYTFSQKSSGVNSSSFFYAIFLLLLPFGKSEPSNKYLQQDQQTARVLQREVPGQGHPLQTETFSLPLDSNRQSYSNSRTLPQGQRDRDLSQLRLDGEKSA